MGKHNKGKLFSAHGKDGAAKLFRRIIIIVSAVVILLIILAIVAYYQLLGYLQGDEFRQKVTTTATSALKADKVEVLSNFKINGDRVSFDGVDVARFSAFEQVHVGGTSAAINRMALLSQKLHLEKLSLEEASVVAIVGENPAVKPARIPASKSYSIKPRKAGKQDSINSESFQLDLLECKDTDINYTVNGKTYQLLGAQVSAEPAPKINPAAWQINAQNARFHTPFSFLRDSSIKSAALVYTPDSVDLTDSSIMLTPGELRAKAHYDLKSNRWTGDLQVNKGDIRRILNDDWKKRLMGEMYGRMVLTGEASSIASATGNLSILNGVLEGLPFLSQLPMGNTYPYRTIELEKADCQILYPYNDDQVKNAWMFNKINLMAKGGYLIIHGHILVGEGGKLSGTLTIGLPERVVRTLPVSREELADQLFTAEGEEKGYMWVNMNLSGTVDKPQEDLSIRIATLVGQNLGKAVTDIPVSAASNLLNTLLRSKPKASQDEDDEEPGDENEDVGSDDEDTPAPASPINDAMDAAGSLLRSLF